MLLLTHLPDFKFDNSAKKEIEIYAIVHAIYRYVHLKFMISTMNLGKVKC